MAFIFILLGIAALVAVLYNKLIRSKNQVENVFGALDALLKKRYDLIPNLVDVTKEYMKYEKETLVEITRLRTQAMSGNISDSEKMQINDKIGRLGRGLMIAVENYPNLKANESFAHLQSQWSEVEEQISAGRRAYNGAVTDYNNAIEMFPTNLMANAMNYQRKDVLETAEEERENISAKDLFNPKEEA